MLDETNTFFLTHYLKLTETFLYEVHGCGMGCKIQCCLDKNDLSPRQKVLPGQKMIHHLGKDGSSSTKAICCFYKNDLSLK